MNNTNSFNFDKYIPSLSDKSKANEILDIIKRMDPHNNQITIDFKGLLAMTTICARLIFGKLYVELGAELYSKNIIMKNAEESIQIVIRWGISKELEQRYSI